MFKKLFAVLSAMLALAGTATAQAGGCGVSAEYFLSKVRYSGGATSIVLPSVFPASAIDTCGHFAFYYEDLRIVSLGSPAAGFADATRGAALRANMCDVVNYIEQVFDFSAIPSTEKIRIYVDTSLSAAVKPLPDTLGWGYDYGVGSAYYSGGTGSGVVRGHVEQFIRSGTDPSPGNYHGTMQMNLYHALWPPILSTGKGFGDWYDWSNYYIGTGTATLCQPDFFQRGLHVMGHILGFAAFHYGLTHHGSGSPGTLFTVLEDSLYSGGDPLLTPAFFSSFTKGRTSTTLKGQLWVNNKANPDNYPFSDMHLEDASFYRSRMSPGDYRPNVMGQINDWGVMKREFTKGDLEVFINRIGLPPNPVSFSSSGTHAALFANHVPTSDRMASMDMSFALNQSAAPEYLPTDFTLVNNTGASLTIDLTTMTSDLRDDDGDSITIMEGSLVNLRGCGSGGNNHDLLSVNAARNVITYTPREDYYGRSQFAFNLWDGKEKGAYVIFTIDVLKGTAVSVPKGDNIVLNGDFEEGSEVRMLGNTVNNFCNNRNGIGKTGRLLEGHHFADAHPYDCYTNSEGNAIRGSYADCAVVDAGFGNPFTSFPWTGGGVAFGDSWRGAVGKPEFTPDASFPAGVTSNDRYMILSPRGALLYLASPLKQCRKYRLEYDIRHVFSPTEWAGYTPKTPVYVAFTDSSRLMDVQDIRPGGSLGLLTYNQTLPVHTVSGITHTAWKHDTLYFTYCPTDSSNILYFNIAGQEGTTATELVDNISIIEVDDIPLSVNIASTQVSQCEAALTASDIINGCEGVSFQWREKGKAPVLATGRVFTLPNPNLPTVYQVTVFDGCSTATGETELRPCPCSGGDVFGAPFTKIAATTLSSATLPPGYYELDHDITVSGATTFNGANILVSPGVAIFVGNTAMLTLDSAHLFTCPDTNRLWAGIRLQSAGSGSGRIRVRNNSLIEDAHYAILATNIKAPPSGNIIDISNSTFNRNWIGLSVNGAYTPGSAGTYPIKVENALFTARHFDTMAGYPLRWAPTVRLREELATVTHTKAPYRISRDYAKAYLKNDTMAYMGIEFHNTGNTLVPGSSYAEVLVGEPGSGTNRNIIDNMNYGVYSNNSNLNLVNTHIINIGKRMYPDDDTNHTYPSSAGWGIIGRSTGIRANRVKIGSSANTGVKLYDCFTGIYMDDVADVDIRAVTIGSSHTEGAAVPGAARSSETYAGYGIQLIGNNNHLKWNLSQNTISNANTGIYLWILNPVAGATTSIANNNVYGKNTEPKFAGLTAGQYVMNALVADGPGYSPVSTLSIVTNTLDGVYNGILLNSLRSAKPLVDNNTIVLRDKTMTTIGTPQYGISALNCQEATISGNTVSTATLGARDNAKFIKAYYASNNTNLRLCSNFSTRIGSAFVFDGRTAQVGTRWIGNSINDGWQGMTLASDIGDQGFMYNWATMFPPTFYGPTGNKWIGLSGLTKDETVAVDPTNTMLSKLYVNNITTGAVERPTDNTSLPPSLPFPQFYDYATTTRSIRVSNTVVANCHGAIYPGQVDPRPDISAPFRIVGGLGRLVVQDSLGYGSSYRVNQWCSQLAVYELATLHPELRDSSGLLDTFMTQAAGSRFAWLTAIGEALGTGDIAAAQSLLNSPVQAMGRVAANGTVVVTDYAEANGIVSDYLACYHAHIRMLQHSSTPADTAILGAIARKCPAVAGAEVYRARGLYRVLTGLSVQYQDDSCAYGGQSLYRIAPGGGAFPSFEEPGVGYSLYPNPNKGIFSIRQTTPADKAVEARVYNAWGQEVHRETVHFKNGMATFKLQNAVPGLYLICLTEGQKTSCLKFNIQ